MSTFRLVFWTIWKREEWLLFHHLSETVKDADILFGGLKDESSR